MFKLISSTTRVLCVLLSLLFLPMSVVAETISGNVDFATRVQIQPLNKGIITKVNVNVGDSVSAGSVLIELDSTRQQAKVEIIENQVSINRITLENANSKFSRQQELFDRGSLSLLQFEEAENAVEIARLNLVSAQAKLRKAKHRLSLTKLKSPINAIVVSSIAHSGMSIHPELLQFSPLMTIASNGDYIAKFFVSLEIWHHLFEKQTIEVNVGAQTYSASVEPSTLDPLPFLDEPEYEIRLRFRESDRLILPGTIATITI